jgi:glycosyltransferase involved in cell wall biosynthesis
MEQKNIRCIVISDFGVKGSGYLNIAAPLCNGLHNKGFQIKALGMGYTGEPHPYDFSIIPTKNIQEIKAMLTNFQTLWKPDVVIVAMDIPYQQMVLKITEELQVPQLCITAIEAGPLCLSWALILQRMKKLFLISQLGTDECIKKGLEAEHLFVGVDTEAWRMAVDGEKDKIRESLGIGKDEFVILTVADNQERKNLSKAFEIVSKFKKMVKSQIRYILVTRENSNVGWKLRDLSVDFEINSNLMILERGMSFQQLWGMYIMSDVFLLTSKAEGLCMPVLEAMSCCIPIISTNAGALPELLSDDRGFCVDYDYVYIDPWGNSNRYMIDADKAVIAMNYVYNNRDYVDKVQVNNARKYVEFRTWKYPVEQVEKSIMEIIKNVKEE